MSPVPFSFPAVWLSLAVHWDSSSICTALQLQAAWHLHKGKDQPVIPVLALVQTPLADLRVTLTSSVLYLTFPMSDVPKSVFVHTHK